MFLLLLHGILDRYEYGFCVLLDCASPKLMLFSQKSWKDVKEMEYTESRPGIGRYHGRHAILVEWKIELKQKQTKANLSHACNYGRNHGITMMCVCVCDWRMANSSKQ